MSITNNTTFGSLPRTVRGQNILIGADPKNKKNILYTCGISIVIRDTENPKNCELYNEHSTEATVARYSPSGFYICSADQHGNIRIWDTQNAEHILKAEFRALSGKINDLQWSEDSKRIILGGEGKERFGAAIMWDTGNNVGEITGQQKSLNSIDCKQARPYRIVTASEDFSSAFYNAFPAKLNGIHKEHTRFAQCVRFSPDGSVYASSGSDGKIFIHDGKTGEPMYELGSPAHKGSVMCISFSPDSSKLLSASADKTCKVWDVKGNSMVAEFNMGSSTEDQQLGCLWQGDTLLSIALGGWITYLDLDNPSKPKKVIHGHNKLITALKPSADGSKFYSASFDGRICCWDIATGDATMITGAGHTNQVCDLDIDGDTLVSAGMDDSVRFNSTSAYEYGNEREACESMPEAMSVGGGVTGVACRNHVEVFKGKSKHSTTPASYTPCSISVSPDGKTIAVGGKDSKTHIYSVEGSALKEIKVIDGKGEISAVAFSPDGSNLATGDSNRNVRYYSTADWEPKPTMWTFHTAKITSLSWSPNSKYIASGGIDAQLLVWNLEKPTKRLSVKHAHVGIINKVAFLNDTTVLSAGHDCTIKMWDLTHH